MKNYYLVLNVRGGMDGMCFNENVGWVYPLFPHEYMARRFIEENPQNKGFLVIKKVKVDTRQSW